MKKTPLAQDIKKNKYLYMMIIPVVLYYIIFQYIPVLGNVIAFEDFKPLKGLFGSRFVGLENFKTFFSSPFAARVIRNTILVNVFDILFGFPLPIIFALMLNELPKRFNGFKKTVQSVSYFPHFISLVVMCGLLSDFSRSTGVFGQIFQIFGLEPVNLLSDNRYFRALFVGSGIWKQLGWNSIIYLVVLSSVDPTLYESACIDGASRFKRLWYITLPALTSIVTIQFILRMGYMMTAGFEKVILLYNPLTYETADVISSFVYRRGLEELDYSFGTAVDLFNSVINIIILCVSNALARRTMKESLW